jgi:TonB family protein
MKLKALIPLISCLFYFHEASAQRRNIYFFKDNGTEVKVRDSADFIRVVSEPDSGSTLYNVVELYLNNKPKLMGKSSQIEYLRLQGQAITYYPSGKKKEVAIYKDGIKWGDVYEYYPNGTLYNHKQYLSTDTSTTTGFGTKVLIIDCLDSTGKVLVVNSNGYYIGYDKDFKNVYEEGNIKSGLKDGAWKGGYKNKDNSLSFKEEYSNDKMLSGQVIDEDGKTYNYTERDILPKYKGGIQAFGKYLGENIKYPYDARRNNIQGKVLIKFVVEKDGSLTDFSVVKNPNDELSAEALRVLKESPKWIPGMQYGKAVRVSYTVPVNFTLGHP